MADTKNTREKQEERRERLELIKEFLVKNQKIVLPAALAAVLLLTAAVGLLAHSKKETKEDIQAASEADPEFTTGEEEGIPVPDVPLEENAYPEVNDLMLRYYKAMESGDMDGLYEIVSPLTDSYLIRLTEWAKHVAACPVVMVYTKPGPIEDSFIAYVYTEIQMVGYTDKNVPGIASFYVCKNAAGNYYINIEEEIDDDIADYIKAINLQDDVKDLNNKVTAEFNNLVAEDAAFADHYVTVTQSITKGIGEGLAALNVPEEPAEEEAGEEPAVEASATIKVVKATDVVNKRSSDSEISDKLGKAQIGDQFTVLEERANGWTKLTDGTTEFFIKSEYLETVSEQPVPGGAAETAAAEEPAAGGTAYVTATTTVNIRKSDSETADRLGKVNQGDKLELIEKQSNGWSKVKYNGKTAYVKSEFVR